jgi:hypothetical protein
VPWIGQAVNLLFGVTPPSNRDARHAVSEATAVERAAFGRKRLRGRTGARRLLIETGLGQADRAAVSRNGPVNANSSRNVSFKYELG